MAKVSEEKKEFARVLYMSGEQQNIIADKVGVSKNTVSRWVISDGWDKRRAAQTISRPELVNKILRAIDKELEDGFNGPNTKADSDRLAKLAASIKNLNKKASVVDVIEVFMGFGGWLNKRAGVDSTMNEKLVKDINRFQDLYISDILSASDAE